MGHRKILKQYAFCKCFEFASNDTAFFNNDISTGVYIEISSYYRDVFARIDSLAKQTARQIKPTEIPDYNNKKAVLKDCFLFYESKVLDSLIKTMNKDYFHTKGW